MRVTFKDGRFDLSDGYEWPQVVQVDREMRGGVLSTNVRVLVFYSKQHGAFTVECHPEELERAPTAVKRRPWVGDEG
jgi:hypothetical protein